MKDTGLGVILIKATVSPHIVAVIGRRKSTPQTSRTRSPASTLPFLRIDDPGWISLTDITRTIPSVPRFNLIPIRSERNNTSRSGPVLTVVGEVGVCVGQAFGARGKFGVDFSA
jgi:hypothetical protein